MQNTVQKINFAKNSTDVYKYDINKICIKTKKNFNSPIKRSFRIENAIFQHWYK